MGTIAANQWFPSGIACVASRGVIGIGSESSMAMDKRKPDGAEGEIELDSRIQDVIGKSLQAHFDDILDDADADWASQESHYVLQKIHQGPGQDVSQPASAKEPLRYHIQRFNKAKVRRTLREGNMESLKITRIGGNVVQLLGLTMSKEAAESPAVPVD